MALQYKTRGDTGPQGKSRVYFCCHEEDHRRWFGPVARYILDAHNCALWHLGEGQPDGDHWEDLEQMQLFVLPVTRRLLTTPNRALDREFPFALEHHIPVLPLMMDEGLVQTFNERCGDLQYLDPNARDDTALSFEDKLKAYLDQVLVGDEMADKIRAAFDAYVFLSYRKKDRKYAQQLMRLIHKNDFCRDIAIWYDEFLVPGENFNDAIRDALKRSHLFVLAVTPNLINEKNYVTTTEYPMARDAGKPILPAQMVDTDRQELERQYRDIPPCTDAADADALARALEQGLRALALGTRDSGPEHRFFMGLAYLGGVDVEVDQERALELITSAAGDGLAEAMEQLHRMYRTGTGVARDIPEATRWLEAKGERRKQDFQARPGVDTAHALFLTCQQLCDWYRELGDEKTPYHWICTGQNCLDQVMADKRLWPIRKLSSLLPAPKAHPTLRLDRVRSYLAEARYFAGRDCHESAVREPCEAAMALCRELEAEGEIVPRREMSICCERLGDLSRDQGKPEQAEEWYRQSLELSEYLAREENTVRARRDLAIGYGKLCALCRDREDEAGARAWEDKILTLRQALARETGLPEDRLALALCWSRLGDQCYNDGDLAGARRWYEKALGEDTAVAEEEGSVAAQRNLAGDWYDLGCLCEEEGDQKQAVAWYEKAAALREQLRKQTDAERDWCACFDPAFRLGELCLEAGDLDGADQWFRQCGQHDQSLEERRNLGRLYQRLGDLRAARGDRRGREYEYGNALGNLLQVARQTNRLADRRALARFYVEFSREGMAAEYLLGLAVEQYEALAQRTGGLDDRQDLADTREKLGDACRPQQSWAKSRECFDKAQGHYRRSLELRRAVHKEQPSADTRRNVSISCERLGDLYQEYGEPGAEDWYRQALEAARAVAKQDPSPQYREEVAMLCHKLNSGEMSPRSWKHWQKEEVKVWEELSRDYPDNPDYRQKLEKARRYL